MLLQLGFGRGHVGHVHGSADDAGIAQGDFGEGDGATLPAHHRETLGFEDRVLAARRGGQVALGFVQRALAHARRFDAGGAGMGEEGVIGPA